MCIDVTTIDSHISDAEPKLLEVVVLRVWILSGQGYDGSRACMLLHLRWSSFRKIQYGLRVAMSCTDEN